MPLRRASFLIIASIALFLLVMQALPQRRVALSIPKYAVPTIPTLSQTTPQFKDATLDWNVVAAHQQTDEQLSALTETLGAGVCAIDANMDGWVDLFFVGGSGHTRHYGRKSWWHVDAGNRLLLNINGHHFTDITEQSGLGNLQWGMGCAVGDLDNNGWPDLIVTGVDSNTIYSNTGNANFVDVTADSGIAAEIWSTGASLADYNNDSLIDVYISNYVAYKKGAPTYERNKGFVSNEVAFDATLYDPLPNKLYLNEGNFKFRDTTESAGVGDGRGRSLGAHWTDLNADGWQDLIVINDVDSPNQVYLNDGGVSFTLSEAQYSLIETPESHDLLEDDFDNDGINEMLITQNGGAAPIFAARASGGTEKFSDKAWVSGIADRRNLNVVNWGAASGDFNNDGNVDLYIANGDLKPDLDSPFVAQAQHNQILLGLGNGKFMRARASHDASNPLSSRSAITADLNNDGTLEIIVTNNNDPLQIFENISETNHHWVGFDLFGSNSFAQVSGAQISVKTGGITLRRTAHIKQGYLANGDARLHFGLGNNDAPIDVTIDWPDGTQSFFTELEANAYYSVDKAEHSIAAIPSVIASPGPLQPPLDDYDNAARANLGELLLQMSNTDSDRQFSSLWDTSNDAVKQSLLHSFRQHWDPGYLAYVKRALESDSVELKILAIEQLKSLELEYSIPWLIPLLAHESEKVSCAVANTLQFFFEEEEAVTHRKYLSVAPLIQMLETGAAKASVCAANALAAAESKRAILPLMTQSEKRSEEEVKLASIRALGLIRDNLAASLLTGIVGNPENHAPAVVAEALIALKRLNDPNIEAYLDGIFYTDSNDPAIGTLNQFQITNSLIANSDTIAFPKRYLFEKIHALMDRRSLEAVIAGNVSNDLAAEVLTTIRLCQLQEYQHFAKQLIGDDNPKVRKSAYEALVTLDKNWEETVLPGLLERESTALVLDVLNTAGQSGTALNPLILKKLGARLDSHGPLAADLEPVLDSLNIANARELLAAHYSEDLSSDNLRKMLSLCDTHSTAISSAFSAADLQQSPTLRYVYLYCRFGVNTSNEKASSSKWADSLLLKEVIESTEYTDDEKQQLIIRAAANDRVTAEAMLLNSVQSYTGDNLLQAIEVLSQHQLTSSLSPFLWALLKDVNTPPAIRFEAAKLLLPTEGDTVSEYVTREFLTDATI